MRIATPIALGLTVLLVAAPVHACANEMVSSHLGGWPRAGILAFGGLLLHALLLAFLPTRAQRLWMLGAIGSLVVMADFGLHMGGRAGETFAILGLYLAVGTLHANHHVGAKRATAAPTPSVESDAPEAPVAASEADPTAASEADPTTSSDRAA
jgi:hypothetical protein